MGGKLFHNFYWGQNLCPGGGDVCDVDSIINGELISCPHTGKKNLLNTFAMFKLNISQFASHKVPSVQMLSLVGGIGCNQMNDIITQNSTGTSSSAQQFRGMYHGNTYQCTDDNGSIQYQTMNCNNGSCVPT